MMFLQIVRRFFIFYFLFFFFGYLSTPEKSAFLQVSDQHVST